MGEPANGGENMTPREAIKTGIVSYLSDIHKDLAENWAENIERSIETAGYRIVPLEPTVDMLAAAYPAADIPPEPMFANAYRAMVNAYVPTADAQEPS